MSVRRELVLGTSLWEPIERRGYDGGMQKALGLVALAFSILCLSLTVMWLKHLSTVSWKRIPANMANMPVDSAIGVTVTAVAVALLIIGVSMLGPTRRPPS